MNLRTARKIQATVTPGAGNKVDFDIEQDVNENDLPISFLIRRIQVAPSASTLFALRIFGKESRISDPTNANYSLLYEDVWSALDVASIEKSFDSTPVPYEDEDAEHGTNYAGKMWCQIEVKTGENASAFAITVSFD